MKHSFFVRRQLMLVVATIVVTAVLISIVFNMVAGDVFVRQKIEEYTSDANVVAQWYAQYAVYGTISKGEYAFWVEGNINQWDARVAIFNADGSLHTVTTEMVEDPSTGQLIEDATPGEERRVTRIVKPYVGQVLLGNRITIKGGGYLFRTGDLIVGLPVIVNDQVVAAVFMTRRLSELSAALDSFNYALTLSILGVLFVMLLPTYVGAKLLARPLHQMRDVALRMARGDFTAKANTHTKGEIGELGGTLNFLSERLSFTIQELRLEKNRLASIVDGLGEGILAVDAQGEITHFNPALLTMFAPKSLSVGAWDRMLLVPDKGLWDDFELTIQNGAPMVRNFTWNGAELMVTISPLENEIGRSEGAVGLFRDVTEQARLEQTRRDYVANVSHELRTPVSSVRGLAEALKDGLIKTEEDRQRYYGFILRETARLTRLIEDLLELSRLQSGTVALKRMRVDMAELLREFADRYEQSTSEVGIHFALELPSPCPDALTNPDRVEQVLVVLVDNAIKFTPTDGSITVRAHREGEHLRLWVIDTGMGVDQQDLPHIFERFYKADKAHTGQGTGLGLSIAHEIVQMLGGKLTVESQEGQGSAFSFTVPVYPGQE